LSIGFIRFINIILAALVAGVGLGILVGLNPSQFTANTYFQVQQHTIRSLKLLMTILVLAALATTLVSAILQKRNRRVFLTLALAAACFLGCIVISYVGNKPIDDLLISWSEATIPVNWTELKHTWWSYHIARTGLALLALILVTWSGVKKTYVYTI
jgi:hypothetical protein